MPKIEVGVPEVHEKSWGREFWIENHDLYCGKILEFDKAGSGTSMHFHRDKVETMYLQKGKLRVELINTSDGLKYELVLLPGQKIFLDTFQPHRLTALEDGTVLYEFSTHHEDFDSYRVGPRNG